MPRLCSQCHAHIADPITAATCPACDGVLIPETRPHLDPPGAPARDADHRGILLPRRHAVGGVITPR